MAGDGEEQDAYILGVGEAVSSFEGIVIGGVLRKNDCEDKLVVAPLGSLYHQGQIAEAVAFQEQYFDSVVKSLYRKSCGVIPFRQKGEDREYLILLQINHFWSFPKGHMEAGETEEQTALRELWEETGLHTQLLPHTRTVVTLPGYKSPLGKKDIVLFLGEVDSNVIPLKSEVLEYQWVKAHELKDYLSPETYEACAALLTHM
jgi:tRNA nucleotidyltransferase (CCA-adding enzyme)